MCDEAPTHATTCYSGFALSINTQHCMLPCDYFDADRGRQLHLPARAAPVFTPSASAVSSSLTGLEANGDI